MRSFSGWVSRRRPRAEHVQTRRLTAGAEGCDWHRETHRFFVSAVALERTPSTGSTHYRLIEDDPHTNRRTPIGGGNPVQVHARSLASYPSSSSPSSSASSSSTS